jgi:uncharacterized protein (TIGR03492 family)
MKSKGVLFLSNGHGEDAINCHILKALRASGADVEVSAMPVVGDGAAYSRSTVPIIGPTSKMPSGGVFCMNPLFLLKNIGAGLIAVTKAAIAGCLEAFALLRFGGGDWEYCRGADRPCQKPPLYNFSIGSF